MFDDKSYTEWDSVHAGYRGSIRKRSFVWYKWPLIYNAMNNFLFSSDDKKLKKTNSITELKIHDAPHKQGSPRLFIH